jgi:hypothetical protein
MVVGLAVAALLTGSLARADRIGLAPTTASDKALPAMQGDPANTPLARMAGQRKDAPLDLTVRHDRLTAGPDQRCSSRRTERKSTASTALQKM